MNVYERNRYVTKNILIKTLDFLNRLKLELELKGENIDMDISDKTTLVNGVPDLVDMKLRVNKRFKDLISCIDEDEHFGVGGLCSIMHNIIAGPNKSKILLSPTSGTFISLEINPASIHTYLDVDIIEYRDLIVSTGGDRSKAYWWPKIQIGSEDEIIGINERIEFLEKFIKFLE